MKITVLNGSPKGDVSVTMQYVAYLKKKFPGHQYEIFNIAHGIRKIEKEPAEWEKVIGGVRSSDLVIWAFPLYYLLVSSQYKRFIELVFERGAGDAFAGKYAASLSTSIHFFDQTAHAYIRGICDDLGMRYVEGYSAEMHDLLREEERARFEKFGALLLSAVEKRIPVRRDNPALVMPALSYTPGGDQKTTDPGSKKVVILTDDDGRSKNLTAMVDRLSKAFAGKAALFNLHELDIRGGCLGCCRCGYDNTCVYTDGYAGFFRDVLMPADIIIIAGAVHDRYLSSKWKQFFDRSFFKGHTPGLEGKQIGFLISGPYGQIPSLREVLTAWIDVGGCHMQVVTDEVPGSGELDSLVDSMADRLVQAAGTGYVPPHTFYEVGGYKIFRDNIYAGMRFIFQADYRYYRDHHLFDFPQKQWNTRLMNAVFMPLTRIPGFRKKVFGDIPHHMIESFKPVLEDT